MRRWTTNLAEVEIEITSFCNLACFNCNRSVRQAPTTESMSLSQIEKFVSESLNMNWEWKQVTLIGGEPTLHPQFWEILAAIKIYKSAHPDCNVEVCTNGYGPRVQHVLAQIPSWVTVDNSGKQSNKHKFSSYNVAPIDVPQFKNADFSGGCWITSECGLGLTRNGYYPCGAGGSVDRVFGFDVGLKELTLVNSDSTVRQLAELCGHCGHFKENYGAQPIEEELMSVTWQRAYAAYKHNKPTLSSY
jgi:hypothetical protein